MAEQPQQPGPGRSTSDAAFNQLRKDVAERNELAHKEARVLRAERDREQIRKHRERDRA
jgi:hypothetical protein